MDIFIKKSPICYMCAEFGYDSDLPTYAGGLGILAGDIMNQAADEDYPMVGIGILYKGKSFIQHINGQGKEEKRDSEFDQDSSFLRPVTKNGEVLKILLLEHEGKKVFVKAYYIRLSEHVLLYFLSSDVDGNPREWREDMQTLYFGDSESQIRQQILLGHGGGKLINELGIKPKRFHINEGRPEFIVWHIAQNIQKKERVDFRSALKKAREFVVYTNHTLVAAGNLKYPVETVKKWVDPIAKELKVAVDDLISTGLSENTFDITKFAILNSHKQSSVSQVHAKYAKEQWSEVNWIPITNGVHMNRWQERVFANPNLTDESLWKAHLDKKVQLQETVLKRTGVDYDPNRLIIVWSRRLAEYKQPKVIFSDLTRLKQIVSVQDKEVQILFAGNSHSGDPNSQLLINEIIEVFSNELSGYAIFVPNYNISLANHLTSGADLWLNTPMGNLEACGTSGMKAASNGVINCTVLDGWTYEVDWSNSGWILDPEKTADDFYDKLEKEIVPCFYSRDENNIPKQWIEKMRSSIDISKEFSTEKMLREYKSLLYS